MTQATAARLPQQEERRNYTRNAHAPGLARAYVRMRLGQWQLRHMADPVELVADELMANSVQYSTGLNVMLWLVRTSTSIVIHVWDNNPDPATPRHARDDDENGRGLAIVAALTAKRGTYPYAGGKVTWGEVMR